MKKIEIMREAVLFLVVLPCFLSAGPAPQLLYEDRLRQFYTTAAIPRAAKTVLAKLNPPIFNQHKISYTKVVKNQHLATAATTTTTATTTATTATTTASTTTTTTTTTTTMATTTVANTTTITTKAQNEHKEFILEAQTFVSQESDTTTGQSKLATEIPETLPPVTIVRTVPANEISDEILETTTSLPTDLLEAFTVRVSSSSSFSERVSFSSISSTEKEVAKTTSTTTSTTTGIPAARVLIRNESRLNDNIFFILSTTESATENQTRSYVPVPSSTSTTSTTTTTTTSSTTEETTTMGEPLPPEDLPSKLAPTVYDYQNDAHWEDSENFNYEAYEEDVEEKKLNEPFIRQKILRPEPGFSSMKIVVKPLKYVSSAMVRLKYEQISDDPTAEMSEDASSHKMSNPEIRVFPLKDELQELSLDGLADGWYHVCGEAINKDNKVLEKSCFHARILTVQHKWNQSWQIGIIAIISIVVIALFSLTIYSIYFKVHENRRKQKDKELQERVEKMAQKEREILEREKVMFNQIYVDPDEPYEERCIM